jgi:hypothetical protein
MNAPADIEAWAGFGDGPARLGRRVGDAFEALNPTRRDRKPGSFRINLRSGKWADFATGEIQTLRWDYVGADLIIPDSKTGARRIPLGRHPSPERTHPQAARPRGHPAAQGSCLRRDEGRGRASSAAQRPLARPATSARPGSLE